MRYFPIFIVVLFSFLPGLNFAQTETEKGSEKPDPVLSDSPPVLSDSPQDVETEPTDPSTPATTDRPKRDKYLAMAQRGREIQKQTNRLIGSLPIGFPKLRKLQTAKIEALKIEGEVLKTQMRQAVIDAFMEAPAEDPGISRFALNVMVSSLNPQNKDQKFDPELAMQIANGFMDNDVKEPQIYFMAFRAAYAMQDFELAHSILESVEEMGNKLDQVVWERLDTTAKNWSRELMLRKLESEADDLPQVKFETTMGDFVAELYENQAPNTVANFINLVEKGFYDGLTFHLVKPGTLSQSGCPNGDGKGGPGYNIACECKDEDARHHFSGVLSMSNSGEDSGGSQFFIAHQSNPILDGKYTVFGRIIDNLDLVYEMPRIDKTRMIQNQPEPVVINKVTVLRKRNHEYTPIIVDKTEPDSKPEIDSKETDSKSIDGSATPETTPSEGSGGSDLPDGSGIQSLNRLPALSS